MHDSIPKKWGWMLLITLASLWASGYVQREYNAFKGTDPIFQGDFTVYYTAGIVARSESDNDLYSLVEVRDGRGNSHFLNPQFRSADPESNFAKNFPTGGESMQYLYPPFFTLFMMILSLLSLKQAMILWYALCIFFLWFSIFLIIKLYVQQLVRAILISLALLGLLEFTFPIQDNLAAGNVATLILALCSLGIYSYNKFPSLSAFSIAVAIAIKLTPAALIPLFIIKKEWKWLIAFTVSFISIILISVGLLGWENHYTFLFRVMPAMSGGFPLFGNQSISTALYALANGQFLNVDEYVNSNIDPDMGFSSLLSKLLSVVSFVAILYFLHFYRRNNPHYINMSVVFLWMLIFSPISFRHSYALSITPVIIAWMEARSRSVTTANMVFLSIGTFLMLSIVPTYIATALPIFPIQLLVSLSMPVGAMLCIVFLLLLSPTNDSEQIPTL